MSASFAPSGSPSTALMVWSDDRYIYAELPQSSPTAPPCILSFSRNSAGLSKLLSLILSRTETVATSPTRTRVLSGTPLQHASAEALLRKRGIIK